MIGADLAVLFVPFLDGSSNRVEAGTDLEVPVFVFPAKGKILNFVKWAAMQFPLSLCLI